MRCAGFSASTGVDMEVRIELYNAHHLDAVIRLSLSQTHRAVKFGAVVAKVYVIEHGLIKRMDIESIDL
jgi:hypothetical protein